MQKLIPTRLLALLGLMLWFPPLSADSFVATYSPSNTAEAGTTMGYDLHLQEHILAQVDRINTLPPGSKLSLDLIFRPAPGSNNVTRYAADFLDLKNADFELVDLLSAKAGYLVFINKKHTATGNWSSYVLRIDRDTLNVVWSKKLSLGDDQTTIRMRQAKPTQSGTVVLVQLDNEEFWGAKGVLHLDANGAIDWAKTYHFTDSVDLLGIHYQYSTGVVVAGSFSDGDDSLETVLLQLNPSDGSLVQAKHFNSLYSWPFLRTPIVDRGKKILKGVDIFLMANTTESGQVAVIPLDSSLNTPGGFRINTGDTEFFPAAAAFNSNGAIVIALEDSTNSQADHLMWFNYSDPSYPLMARLFNLNSLVPGIDLRYASRGVGESVLAGTVPSSNPLVPAITVVETLADGLLEYCFDDSSRWVQSFYPPTIQLTGTESTLSVETVNFETIKFVTSWISEDLLNCN